MAASAPVKTRKSAPGQTASIGPATGSGHVRRHAFAETASPEDPGGSRKQRIFTRQA